MGTRLKGLLPPRQRERRMIAAIACVAAFGPSAAQAAWLQSGDAATILQISGRPATGEPIAPKVTVPPITASGVPLSPTQTQQIDLCQTDHAHPSRRDAPVTCSKRRAGSDGLSVEPAETSGDLGAAAPHGSAPAQPAGSTPNADVIANRLRTGDVQTSAVADSVGVGLRTSSRTSPPDAAPLVPR